MARIRSVHPGLLTDEAFMQLTLDCPLAVTLLIGLWMEADDSGAFEWKPLTLKARILPAAPASVEDLLDRLAAGDFLRRFEIGGRAFGVIRNFVRYQRPRDPIDVHPFTPETRAYAGFVEGRRPRPARGRPGKDEADLFDPEPAPAEPREAARGNAELPCAERGVIPRKAELSPQREEEGGRRESEEGESVVVVAFPRAAERAKPAEKPTTAEPNDDELFEKFSSALAGKARPHVVKRLVREAKPLLAEGVDLDVDLMAELKEIRTKLRGSLNPGIISRILAQCRDRRDGRLAARRAHVAAKAQVRVSRFSPAGEAWELHRRATEGRGWPWEAGGGYWSFDSEWPPGAAPASGGAA